MKKLVLIGAGGLGKEVSQYIQDINQMQPTYDLLGYIDEDSKKKGMQFNGVEVLGDFDHLQTMIGKYDGLQGFCAVANPRVKQKLIEKMKESGLAFTNILHPTAYIGETVELGKGILVGPYSVITTDVIIGDHVHINPQCGVGHDSRIGEYSTLYWNVNISGNVIIGAKVEIGSKAFIKQGLKVGAEAVVGAGAVVVKDVPSGILVTGVPAKSNEQEEIR